MRHEIIDQIITSAEKAKSDSNAIYFDSLMYLGEGMMKFTVASLLAAIDEDQCEKDEKYELEYRLVRADGLGEWSDSLHKILYEYGSRRMLSRSANNEIRELTQKSKKGDWQYEAIESLKTAWDIIDADAPDIAQSPPLKTWFDLFVVLRNKTRAHGAPQPSTRSNLCMPLNQSLKCIYKEFALFKRPTAFLSRQLSGNYRISPITDGGMDVFDEYKTNTENHNIPDGIYIYFDAAKKVPLIESSSDLEEFYFANGGASNKHFELLSYSKGNTRKGDVSQYSRLPTNPPPQSETEGSRELDIIGKGKCLTNAPPKSKGYVQRKELEAELKSVLLTERYPVVTLRGRGGIGKTSLALKVLSETFDKDGFESVFWFSSRDIDLHETGPKPVSPGVVSNKDIADFFAELTIPEQKKQIDVTQHFEKHLYESNDDALGRSLFVFDNFETADKPQAMHKWLDTHIRPPNKILITTRHRHHYFNGDYSIKVEGLSHDESLELIEQVASYNNIRNLLSDEYIENLIKESQGHPYVLKIHLGAIVQEQKACKLERIVANRDDILEVLFERTYDFFSEITKLVFLTLAAWRSPVPRMAFQAVMMREGEERENYDPAIDELVRLSIVDEIHSEEKEETFLSLPLEASLFGQRKLESSDYQSKIEANSKILQMLGVTQAGQISKNGLERSIHSFFKTLASKINKGQEKLDNYEKILKMICRHYNPGWLLFAKLHEDNKNYAEAKKLIRRFLENKPNPSEAARALNDLQRLCRMTKDYSGEIDALLKEARLDFSPLESASKAAGRLMSLKHDGRLKLNKADYDIIAGSILKLVSSRKAQASPSDLSQAAWVALSISEHKQAERLIGLGLEKDPNHYYCRKMANDLGMDLDVTNQINSDGGSQIFTV